MRILLIDVNYKYSSTGDIVYNIHNYITKNGDFSAVCYGRGEKTNDENVFKFGIDLETKFHALMTRFTGYTGCFSYFSTHRLISFIKKFKPDVVHIHELHAYFVNIKPLLNYLAKNDIPVVWTFHCEFMYTGKCGCGLECEKWKMGCGNCPNLKRYPSTLFFDHTAKMLQDKKKFTDKLNRLIITSPSFWLCDRIRQTFYSNRSICTVYNGVNTTEIYVLRDKTICREELFIDKEKPMALTVAQNVIARSGDSICKMAKRMPDVSFYLIGNGEKPQDYPENIYHLGSITDKELLAKYYAAADVYLLCSKKETFSMPCAEALCCGTQVVGFTAGAPESIFENPYAEFVEYGDFDSLENALKKKLENPVSRNACCDYGNENFSTKAMAENFIKLYKEAIK